MIKMFKFFDVSDKGVVNFSDYAKTLEKLGMYYPPEQLRPLFDSYDVDGSGVLDYKEFTSVVFGREVAHKAYVQ